MGNYTRRAYHSQLPEWRTNPVLSGKYIGVELEVVAKRNNSYHDLLNKLPDFAFGRSPLTETDGSLPSATGVEIIFPPVSYKQLKNPKSVVAKSMKALEELASKTASSPGMHLNVNVRSWSYRKKSVFSAVVMGTHGDTLKKIGGRSPNSYCRVDLNARLDNCVYPRYHMRAVEFGGTRMELRFPKSTTDHEQLKKLVTYIEAVESFASSSVITGAMFNNHTTAMVASKFKDWLKGKKKYEDLYEQIYEKTSKNSAKAAKPGVSVSGSSSPIIGVYPHVSAVSSTTAVQSGDQLGEFLAAASEGISVGTEST